MVVNEGVGMGNVAQELVRTEENRAKGRTLETSTIQAGSGVQGTAQLICFGIFSC